MCQLSLTGMPQLVKHPSQTEVTQQSVTTKLMTTIAMILVTLCCET